MECRKTKTKVITSANQKGGRQSSKPIKTRSNYTKPTQSAGKCVRASHDWFWFHFWLVEKNGARTLNQSLSEVMQNQTNSLITFSLSLLEEQQHLGDTFRVHLIGRSGIYHNTLCLSTQILHKAFHVFVFFWDYCKSQEKLEEKRLCKILKNKQRVLWYFPKWLMRTKQCYWRNEEKPSCFTARIPVHFFAVLHKTTSWKKVATTTWIFNSESFIFYFYIKPVRTSYGIFRPY